jgi:hypothetical protein
MQTFKQYGYLIATFAMLCVFGVIISLSYCGGQTDAKMDNSVVISKEQMEYFKSLEKKLKEVDTKTVKAVERANELEQKFELKSYQYDSLRKAKIIIPTRNFDVYDDSLVRIWTNQNKE